MPHRIVNFISSEICHSFLATFAIPFMGVLGLILEIESRTWGYLSIAGAVAGKFILDETRYRRKERADRAREHKLELAAKAAADREIDLLEQARKDRESERIQDRLDKEALARLTVQTAELLKMDVRTAGQEREARIIRKVDENTDETKAARHDAQAAHHAANGIKATVVDRLDTLLAIVPAAVTPTILDVHVVNDAQDPVLTKPADL